MLGRAFFERMSRTHPLATVRWPDIDFTRPDTILRAVQPGTGVVINCAAYTDVDGAETHEDLASAINSTGVGRLAARCCEVGATLVHFGTDYVFEGQAATPRGIDSPRAPQGAYGRSKALGETLLERSGARHLLVRTSWLYAPWGKNFVRTISSLGTRMDELRVVDDQRGRPTSAEHLATTTLALLEHGALGTWYVTDGGECTWCGFARTIVRLSESTCTVVPCTTAEFPRPAARPAYSVLDVSKTEALLGPMPRWEDNLADVMGRLE